MVNSKDICYVPSFAGAAFNAGAFMWHPSRALVPFPMGISNVHMIVSFLHFKLKAHFLHQVDELNMMAMISFSLRSSTRSCWTPRA